MDKITRSTDKATKIGGVDGEDVRRDSNMNPEMSVESRVNRELAERKPTQRELIEELDKQGVLDSDSSYTPYEDVMHLCAEMNTALLAVENGNLLADLLSAIELVRLKCSAILAVLKEDAAIARSTAALEAERDNG